MKTMAEKTVEDRGVPGTNTGSGKKSPIMKLALVGSGMLAMIALAGGATLFMKRVEEARATAKLEQQTTHQPVADNASSAKNFETEKVRIKANELPPPLIPAAIAVIDEKNTHQVTMSQRLPEQPAIIPADRRLTGDVLVNFQENAVQKGARSTAYEYLPENTNGISPGGLSDTNEVKNDFSNQLTPAKLTPVRATQRPDLTYLMKRGTIIPCVLKTKIVTTYPGLTSCQVTKHIYSANGKIVLIERGSEITGEQRTALTQGQARIFVLWSRVDTPSGVVADINSPGSDALGASGHEAYVDDHFWKRFGGAIMLSLIGDFGQAVSNKYADSGSGQISFSNTTGASENMANEALKNTINIPPTAYANQGALLNVFVARDTDFRGVYDVLQ